MTIFTKKMDTSKTTQKISFWVVWVVFLVRHLCSHSYALLLFEKKHVVTNPVRKTSFPTFPSGIEKWTISRMSFFKNQFTFLKMDVFLNHFYDLKYITLYKNI